MIRPRSAGWALSALACTLMTAACGGSAVPANPAPSAAPSVAQPQTNPAPAPAATSAAPPATTTDGFDGQRAYQYVADLVAIGPRSAGTEGSRRAQQYI